MHCSLFIMAMNSTRILYHTIRDNTKHNEHISHGKDVSQLKIARESFMIILTLI